MLIWKQGTWLTCRLKLLRQADPQTDVQLPLPSSHFGHYGMARPLSSIGYDADL